MTNNEYLNILRGERTSTLGVASDGEIEIITDQSVILQNIHVRIGVVYEDHFIKIVRDPVLFPSGAYGTYIRIIIGHDRVGGVCIVPIVQEKFVLIRHFRHATREWQIEFPRGFAEPNSTLQENASRELHEELAVSSANFSYIGEIFADTGLIASSIAIYSAQLMQSPRALGDTGAATLLLVSRSEVEALIREGALTDAISIAAFSRFILHNRND